MARCKLDLITSIELIEDALNSGRNKFFVNTEFGVIGVEVDNRIMYDPMAPVEICPWVHAPKTQWTMEERYRQADYYMSIDPPETMPSTHLHVVEGMIRCMLHSILGFDPDSRIVDSAVVLYEKINCNKSWTVNYLEQEFCRVNLSILTRNDRVVRMLVRDMIERRIFDADEIISESKMLLTAYGEIGINIDEYNQAVFGLILYTIKRFPERINDINPDILDMICNRKSNVTVVNFNNPVARVAGE